MEVYPHENMRQRIVLYTRVSSDQQVSNTSLDEQERKGLEYCERNDCELVKLFREEGESAKTMDRTQLTKALAFCSDKSNKVDIFLVYKMDRFSRNLENHLRIRSLLKSYGIRLVSMTEVLEDTPSGVLFENILASFAQFDNDIKRERVIGGMLARLNKGIWVWGCPTGYIREEKLLVRDPQRWDIIQKAWEWYGTGKYSQLEVMTFMDDQGYISQRGGKATKSMLSGMYRSPLYMGRIQVPKYDIDVDAIHEPMVTKTMWYEVQDRLQGVTTRYDANPTFVCNRTFYCENCGKALSGSYSTGKLGKKYPYYSCTDYACKNKARMPQDELEGIFMGMLSQITISPQLAQDVKAKVLSKINEMGSVERKKIIAIETQMTNYRKDIDNVGNKLDIGFYSSDEALIKKKELEEKIIRLEILREKSSIQNYNIESILDYSFKILEHLLEAWKSMTTSDKLAFNKLIFPEGIKVGKTVSSNPCINPLFVAIDGVLDGSVSLSDPNPTFLELFLAFFSSLKSLNLSFNFN